MGKGDKHGFVGKGLCIYQIVSHFDQLRRSMGLPLAPMSATRSSCDRFCFRTVVGKPKPVSRRNGQPLLPKLAQVAHLWRSEEAAVIAAELQRAFVTHAVAGAPIKILAIGSSHLINVSVTLLLSASAWFNRCLVSLRERHFAVHVLLKP